MFSGADLQISMEQGGQGTPRLYVDGFEVSGHRVSLNPNSVHQIQVGGRRYYLLANHDGRPMGRPLLMLIPLAHEYAPPATRPASLALGGYRIDSTVSNALQNGLVSFAGLRPGTYTTTGFPAELVIHYEASGVGTEGEFRMRKIFTFEEGQPFSTGEGVGANIAGIRNEIRVNGDQPDHEVPPSRRVDLAATMLGMPTDFVILPDISGVSRIAYGERTQVDRADPSSEDINRGYGSHMAYDFTEGETVFLEVSHRVVGLMETHHGSHEWLRATLYAAAGQTAIIGHQRIMIGGEAPGKYEFEISPTADEQSYAIEVNGVACRITFTQAGGHAYVRVVYGD
ncbi:MAG: hypothetical protein HYU97_00090 [Deltaproteobacteria bacterium]|nr:hypothetical protein [Deltaproteobacteria bacterium]